MSSELSYAFEFLAAELPSFQTSVAKECLLQWNLDPNTLKIKIFRIFGSLSQSSTQADYLSLLTSFIQSSEFRGNFPMSGDITVPIDVGLTVLSNTVTSLAFFDRLENSDIILTPAGNIRGCFEETFDGIVVGDCLREMLVWSRNTTSNFFQ